MINAKLSRRVGKVMSFADSMLDLPDTSKDTLRRHIENANSFSDLPKVWQDKILAAEIEIGITQGGE